MKRFFLNRAATLLMASLVMAGALIAQPVWALIAGQATSTGNTVSAEGADIQINDGTPDVWASGATAAAGSLTAPFTDNTQIIKAGYIDVRNATAGSAWISGYTLSNVLDAGSSSGTPDSNLASAAVTVEIDVINVGTAAGCASGPDSGSAVLTAAIPAVGAPQVPIVDAATWAGPLIGDPSDMIPARTTLNSNDAVERLCFYVVLTAANDNVAGGSLLYDLTFKAK